MAGDSGAGGLLGPMDGSADPADLLASLTAAASSVTKLGPSVIRGVPVTGFALKIDPAKAGARCPAPIEPRSRPSSRASARPRSRWTSGWTARIWSGGRSLSLAMPGGSGAPAGTKLTWTTDFYDFGVPVRVSAPPASQVATEGSKFALGSGEPRDRDPDRAASVPTASPPPVSGTLTPDQATAAEQAVTAFWAAVGRNNTAAVAATVVPAQRSCVQSSLGSGRRSHHLRVRPARHLGAARRELQRDRALHGQGGGEPRRAGPPGPPAGVRAARHGSRRPRWPATGT